MAKAASKKPAPAKLTKVAENAGLTVPRGIRNNNPLNLREAPSDKTNWIGERATDDDKAFEEFETMAHGVRAAMVTLRNYQGKHGLNTCRKIIARWAPAEDNNDPDNYARRVAQVVGCGPDDEIDVYAHDVMARLIAGMSRVENGRKPGGGDWLQQEDIEAAFKLL